MNRLQFADSMILDMGYNDTDSKLDRRQIFAGIDKHFPLILVQMANQFGEGMLNNFTVTTLLNVFFDTGFQRFFVNIPTPMNLRGFAGVRYLGDIANEDMEGAAVPIQTGFLSMMSVLEVGGMSGRYGYYLIGNRAYLKNVGVNVPTALRCTYVPTIMNLSDTDDITCPAETMSILADKLSEVFSLQQKTPENADNDNKDNQ